MDYLKDGIGLRAMAQRDPLVEYQREGFAMFQQMMGQIREETVGFLFNLDVEVTAGAGAVAGPVVAAKGLTPADATEEKLSYTAPSDSGGVEVRNQRGQIQQAATDRARRAATIAASDEEPAESTGPPQRGAFGQKAEGAAPVNRAERRSQGKKTT
jgi:preprotein translocase subunit SecA